MQGNAKWANDNGNSSAYRTAAIRDKDGSLGAGPVSYILINDGVNDSIATDTQACEIKPAWNAAICKGDVGRLNVGGAAGGGRGAGPGSAVGLAVGPAAGPGAGAGRGAPGATGAAPAAGPVAGLGQGAPAGPGGAVGRGGPGAGAGRGGPGGRAGGAPAEPPVVLSRNGKDYTLTGTQLYEPVPRSKVTTERPSVSLSAVGAGQRLVGDFFELPGFNTAASGTEQTSLDALRKAGDTWYFKDQNALWVKVVSPDSGPLGLGGGTTLQVSRWSCPAA